MIHEGMGVGVTSSTNSLTLVLGPVAGRHASSTWWAPVAACWGHQPHYILITQTLHAG